MANESTRADRRRRRAAGGRRPSGARWPGPCAGAPACRTASASAADRSSRRTRRSSRSCRRGGRARWPCAGRRGGRCRHASSASRPAVGHQPDHLVAQPCPPATRAPPCRRRRSRRRHRGRRCARARLGDAPRRRARRGRAHRRPARVPRRRSGTRSTPITVPIPRCRAIAAGHVADRTEPEHHDAPARRDIRVLHRLPCRREHVGEVHEAVVGRALRHLDRPVVGVWHPQQFGLPARHLAVQLGVAEQRAPVPCHGSASSRTATAARGRT